MLAGVFGLLLASVDTNAQAGFPGGPPSRNTIKIQQKAERLYEEGEYQRAFKIFRKELAPIGDKYAQYMVGYMHLTGEGAERDIAAAYGWYLLAAERSHEPLLLAMRELESQLTDAERDAGLAVYEDLKGKLGDRALVRRLIKMDERRLRERTGRVGASVGTRLTVVTRDGRSVDATTYYKAIEQRMERRLAFLQGYVEFGELETIPDELDEIAEDVAAEEAAEEAAGDRADTP